MSVAEPRRRFRRDFGFVSGVVMKDPTISTTAKAVYATFACASDMDGVCKPSNAAISRALGVSPRTVMRCIDELVRAYVMVREPQFDKGRQTKSITRLTDINTEIQG